MRILHPKIGATEMNPQNKKISIFSKIATEIVIEFKRLMESFVLNRKCVGDIFRNITIMCSRGANAKCLCSLKRHDLILVTYLRFDRQLYDTFI
jgi:hypothetical protein